jgi:hypothetical protein
MWHGLTDALKGNRDFPIVQLHLSIEGQFNVHVFSSKL